MVIYQVEAGTQRRDAERNALHVLAFGHNWEFLETPEFKQAKQEIRRLNGALDMLSKPFPGRETLTPRERVALAQIIRGASSKEVGQTLGISPRTVDFHRANLLKKLGARNATDLVHKVLGE
jgi:DNA-binding CsgD family transcriptional regulator